jgi:hypothetical protein
MPSVDRDKLYFYSNDPIDKVVAEGTISIVNSGVTALYVDARVVSQTISNPYGRKCFVRASWTVDGGTSYQSLESQLTYSFNYNTVAPAPVTSTPQRGLKAAISIGVSDSSILFRTANGLHGNVSDNGTTITYTPTSQTFTINYVLFERE